MIFKKNLLNQRKKFPLLKKTRNQNFYSRSKCFIFSFHKILNFQRSEKEYKGFIPDLDEEQVRTVENFRDIVDKGGKFNEKLYEFNEALFNKDEARIQRQKTHKVYFVNLKKKKNYFI